MQPRGLETRGEIAMKRRLVISILVLLVILSCAHTEYYLEPVRFRDIQPTAPPSEPIGKIFFENITVEANSDRFINRDESRTNFLNALETVLWAAGYEVVDQPESSDVINLRASLYTLSNAGGCSGGWNTSQLDLTLLKGGATLFQKQYTNKRRGRSGPRAYTMAVRACLDQFYRDLTSPQWRRKLAKDRT